MKSVAAPLLKIFTQGLLVPVLAQLLPPSVTIFKWYRELVPLL
jgi:hypothetical protein